jgi:hypothetical protein
MRGERFHRTIPCRAAVKADHLARMDATTSATTRLTDAQRLDWLRLIRSDNIGPRAWINLGESFQQRAHRT